MKKLRANFLDPFSTAWSGVATHTMRSLLTVLGVVIGVGAVISLMSIGSGTQQQIVGQIESLGSNLLFVRPGQATQGGVSLGAGSVNSLTYEDSQAIQQQVPNVAAVAPLTTIPVQIVVAGQNTRTTMTGTTPAYQQVNGVIMAQGYFFTQAQYESGTRVAVLGPTTRDNIFGAGAAATGQLIVVGNNILQVIGVFQSKGQSIFGTNDDTIIVPMTAMQQMYGQARTNTGQYVVQSITVAMAEGGNAATVTNQITRLLETRHRLAAGAADDFQVTSVQTIADTLSSITGALTLLLGAIAAISLLVGGIGVMNIMLVSVVERTREIGIRKALGAKDWDIWIQFLLEASILTLAGGAIGIGLGWGASLLVSRFAGLTTLVSPGIIGLAVGVSVGIGIVFGVYPAVRASRLSPIEALRALD